MLKVFKDILITPPAEEIASKTLEDYKRQLLKHQSEAEFNHKMVEFYQVAISRLTKYVAETKS